MTQALKYLLILLTLLFFSCKNYYNDMVEWTNNLPKGSSIDFVKENQPEYLEIDWENPDTLGTEIRFNIVEIEGNNDALNMSNELVFANGKFEGRAANK